MINTVHCKAKILPLGLSPVESGFFCGSSYFAARIHSSQSHTIKIQSNNSFESSSPDVCSRSASKKHPNINICETLDLLKVFMQMHPFCHSNIFIRTNWFSIKQKQIWNWLTKPQTTNKIKTPLWNWNEIKFSVSSHQHWLEAQTWRVSNMKTLFWRKTFSEGLCLGRRVLYFIKYTKHRNNEASWKLF